jgi:hypothetical protein
MKRFGFAIAVAAAPTALSVGGESVQLGTFGGIAIARDPNDLFLEPIEPEGN